MLLSLRGEDGDEEEEEQEGEDPKMESLSAAIQFEVNRHYRKFSQISDTFH